MEQMNMVLLGAPGCGKGTQAQLIADKFGLDPVSTGELFRYEMSHHTIMGDKAHDIIEHGGLCPDSMTMEMLHNHIAKRPDSNGFIFDGVPRTVSQAEMLDKDELFRDLTINMVVYLDVEMQEVEKRILNRARQQNRTDDTPRTVKVRVDNFFKQTMPLVDYYRQQGKLFLIDGMHDVETVFADICSTIETYRNGLRGA